MRTKLSYTLKHFSDLSLEELYAIMVLRQEVFIVEQDCPYIDADGLDQSAWHLLGYDEDGLFCAYTRLLQKGIAYPEYASIGRVITSSKTRSKGYGRELMEVSIQETKRLFNTDAIKISAQCYLLKFYSSLGFEPVGEEYLEDGIPHQGMVLRK